MRTESAGYTRSRFIVYMYEFVKLNRTCSSEGEGTGGSHEKVTDFREARGSQEPMVTTLAKIPNKGDI